MKTAVCLSLFSFLTIVASCGADGQKAARQYYIPLFKESEGWKKIVVGSGEKLYPAVTRPGENYASVKYYDIRAFFVKMGVHFEADDRVFFNPNTATCLVYFAKTSEANVDLMDEMADQLLPIPNVTLEGAISVGAEDETKNPKSARASWRISGECGTQMSCSSENDHGIRYDFKEATSVSGADGKSLDISYELKVTYEGKEYGGERLSNARIEQGKPFKMKVGDMPGGKSIYFHLVVKTQPESKRVGISSKT